MTKKVTAILLALILGLSSMLTVFAEEVQNDAQTEAITESTADVTAKAGEDAVFSVKTLGEVRSFQWQVSKDGGKKWTDLNPKTYGATETLRIPVKENYDGYLYRCEVTFADYRVEHSAPAKLSLSKTVTFASEAVGGVKISVEAPEGALPEGTTMKVDAVSQAAVQNAIDKAADLSGIVLAAADITFYANGAVVEPSAPIKVTMTSEAIASAKNPQVVHLDTTAEELEKSLAEPEKVDAKFEQNKVSFEADQFSVYVVVETIVPRLTVTFKNGSTEIAHMIIKAADTADEVDTIIYDPGVGTLNEGEIFKGWTTVEQYTATTELKTIADVRTAAMEKAATITEDEEVVYYAAIFKTHVITYLSDDEDPITVGTAVAEYPVHDMAKEVAYTVNMGYTVDDTHNFQGWVPNEASQGNIKGYPEGAKSETTASGTIYYYENGTEITVKGDITFIVRAPEGNWLVFDENGKGATYTAPQFVLKGTVTAEPSTMDFMSRVGYTFGGWYDTKEHADAHAADTSVTTGKFVFGDTLSQNTTVYASWIPNTDAVYTILIWKQNIAGNGYDFAESRVLTGTVGQNVSSVAKHDEEEEAYATINGTALTYTGFHLERFDEEVEIVPEGTSVVNVYYNRNTYVLTFEVQGSGYRYDRDDANGTYGCVNGEWVELESEVVDTTTTTEYHLSQNQSHNNNDAYTGTVYSDQNGTTASNPEYPNTYYRRSGSWWQGYTYYVLYWHSVDVVTETKAYTYKDSQGNEHTYTGPRFSRTQVNNNGWHTVKTIVALYQQPIKDYFPIVGTDGVTYTDSRWSPQNSSVFSQVLVYIDIMPAENVTFHRNTANYTTKHMYYYVEALEGETGETRTYNGKKFVLYKQVDANYNFFTQAEDFVDLVGFSKSNDYPPEGYQSDETTPVTTIWENSNAIHVYCYYLRDKYIINYMDGLYVSGRDAVLETRTSQQLKTSDPIYYDASLEDFDITPSLPSGMVGYVFEGWYMDEACNSEYVFAEHNMPVDGVTVYAKWRQIQYRAFLHTGLTSDDGTNLSWGVNEDGTPVNQALSFRIDHGGHLSAPTGTRDGYKFMGWYTDSNFKNVFNETAFVFNEETVTTPYDKTTTMTDPETKVNGVSIYGPWDVPTSGAENSDAKGWNGEDRYWITKKLDLYAKWSRILPGAAGINVVYEADGFDTEGNSVTGSNAPSDAATHMNNSDVNAAAASTAPEGYVFDHWVVCTWDAEAEEFKYTSSSETVLPGETFEVKDTDARIIENSDGTKTYTVQLLAIYKAKEEATPTHIPWYKNDGNEAFHIDTLPSGSTDPDDSTLLINEGVTIQGAQTMAYRVFLGWARVEMGSTAEAVATFESTDTNWTQNLTETDLFLKWDAENGKYLAKDESGEFTVEATQVAADEKTPYHAMFAVWQLTYFYLYHSATGEVEPVVMDEEFDLRNYVTKGTLYGGYYSAYCDLTQDSFVDGVLKDGLTARTYDGTKAYYSGVKAYWKTANAITEDGSAMVPKEGMVYFLKEVPATYLTSKIQFVYDWSKENKLNTIYLLTAVDDKLYGEVGFELAVDNKKVATLASSFTFEQRNTGNQITTKVTDFGVSRGFVGWADGGFETTDGFIAPNTEFTMKPYWKTPDGVVVYGSARSFTTGDKGSKDTLKEITNP